LWASLSLRSRSCICARISGSSSSSSTPPVGPGFLFLVVACDACTFLGHFAACSGSVGGAGASVWVAVWLSVLVAVDSFSSGLVYSCSFASRRVSASNRGMGRYLVGAFCLLSCPSSCSRSLLGHLAAVDGWLLSQLTHRGMASLGQSAKRWVSSAQWEHLAFRLHRVPKCPN